MKALLYLILIVTFFEFSNSENPILEKVLRELKEIRNDLEENKMELQNTKMDLGKTKMELEDTRTKLKTTELKLENSEKKLGKVPDDLEERLGHLEEVTKANVPRTCDDLSYYGVQKSGLYRIDPGKFLFDFLYLLSKQFPFSDGDLIGQPPIEVFCNFETKTTEVLHDFEFQIKIEHCEEIGCAVYNISYSAPMDQIKSLIQLSESCSQSLDFGCFLAPLQEEGVDIGSWADRDGKIEKKSLYLFPLHSMQTLIFAGKPQSFYHGNHPNEHICQCGETDSCLSPAGEIKYRCNCDANEPEFSKDAGTITAMDKLPITQFSYGPLQYGLQRANVTIGRLMCGGKKASANEEVTCGSLKRAGFVQPGLYNLVKAGEKSPRLSYCHMDSESGYENPNLEAKLGYSRIQSLDEGVLFNVYKIGPPNGGTYQGVLTYTNIVSNFGGGMDIESGKFTTPVDGFYNFHFTALTEYERLDRRFVLDVMLDGSVTQIIFDQANVAHNNIAYSWQMQLATGQQVYMQFPENSQGIWSNGGGYPAIFEGQLVKE